MSMFGCVRLKIYETALLNISGRLTSLSDVVSAKSVRSRSNAEQIPDLQLGLLHQNSTTMSNHIISHGQVLVDDSPIHAFAWAANISRLSLMQSADPLASLQPVDTKTARWLNHRKRFVKLHRFHCQSLQTRVFTEAEALESRRGCGIADLDVCYTAGIFSDLVQKHQKHCKEAALPWSMTVMNHAHTCATHWASGDSPKSRSPNSRAAWVFVSKSCEVMTRMRDLGRISRFIYCFGLCSILQWPGLYDAELYGARLVQHGASNSVPYLFIGHLQAGSILVQSLQRKNEERLSSTDSKSSQCDSDHKQSFLYSWDCWEMSLIWPQSSKKRKSACREILY